MILSFYSGRNAEKILGYLNSNVLSHDLIPPHVNFTHLTTADYAEMYGVIKTVKEGSFAQLGLEPCVLEDELNKVSLRHSPPPTQILRMLSPDDAPPLPSLCRQSRAQAWPSSPSRKP